MGIFRRKCLSVLLFCMFMLCTYSSFFSVKNTTTIALTTQTTASNSSTQSSVLWNTGLGLIGQITTDVLVADLNSDGTNDSVVFGTNYNVICLDINTGDILCSYRTKYTVTTVAVIDDEDGDGLKDIVFGTKNRYEPNVLVISTNTSAVIWDFISTEYIFAEEVSWTLATIPWCVRALWTDGACDVLVSIWRNIYRLDGSSGKIQWQFECSDDIWLFSADTDFNNDKVPDILAGSQDGTVYLLDGKTGSELWHRKLTKPYIRKPAEGGPPGQTTVRIDRSIWCTIAINDVTNDQIPEIAVSAEDGYVYLLDGKDGDTLWQYKCMELKEPEKETGYGESNFFNLRVQSIDDIDGDSKQDIVALVRPPESNPEIYILSSDPTKSADNRNITIKKGTQTEVINEMRRVAVTEDLSGDNYPDLLLMVNNKVCIMDKTGNVSHEYYDPGSLINLGEEIQLQLVDNLTGDAMTELLLASTNGVILVDINEAKIIWDYIVYPDITLLELNDINGDNITELLALCTVGTKGGRSQYSTGISSGIVRTMRAINRYTGETLWEFTNPLNNITFEGLHAVRIVDDLNGDCKEDILGYSQLDEYVGEYNGSNNSMLQLIDGTTGELIWTKPVHNRTFIYSNMTVAEGLYADENIINRRINTVDIINDITGDGISDIVVGGEDNQLYILNGANGTNIQTLTSYRASWDQTYYRATTQNTDDNMSYIWFSDIDGVIGNATEIYAALSLGVHNISFIAQNLSGETLCEDNITVTATEPDKARVWITQPAEGDVIFDYETTWFGSMANNFDQRYASFNWSSNIDGKLGTDPWFEKKLSIGVHTIELTVTDEQGRTGNDMVNVTVAKSADLRISSIWIDGDVNDIRTNTGLQFNSNINYPGNQGLLNYTWNFGDGSQQESVQNPTHSYSGPGEYIVILSVTDGMGHNDSCSMTIKARENNQPRAQVNTPSANTIFNVGTSIDFNASNPNLEDFYGEIDNWTWDFDDGFKCFESTCAHNYTVPGYYNVTLTVTNETHSKNDSLTIPLRIVDSGQPCPNIQIDNYKNSYWTGENVYFSGNASVDTDGTITNYTWDFGDGTHAYTAFATQSYAASGTYLVTLMVKDNESKYTNTTVQVKVYDIGAEPSVYCVDEYWQRFESQVKLYVNESIKFNVHSGNLLGEQDYLWDFDDESNSTSTSPTHQFAEPGNYTVNLSVKDEFGRVGTDSVLIRVYPEKWPLVWIREPSNHGKVAGLEIQGIFVDWVPSRPRIYTTDTNSSANTSNIIIAGDGRIHAATSVCGNSALTKKWQYPTTSEGVWTEDDSLIIVGDINCDGISEIMAMENREQGGRQTIIIDGNTGSKMATISESYYNKFVQVSPYTNELFSYDFNEDSYLDALGLSGEGEETPGIYVLSGANGERLWSVEDIYEGSGKDYLNQPQYAALIEDYNNDGVKDVAAGTTLSKEAGARIIILDGKTGSQLDTITYEKQYQFEDWIDLIPVSKIVQLGDITGDGRRDIAVLRYINIPNELQGLQLELVGLAECRSLRNFPISQVNILNTSDINQDGKADIIMVIGGGIYCLDGGFCINILSPPAGMLASDTCALAWDKSELLCEVTVDDAPHGFYKDGNAQLILSSGEHTIKVSATEDFGSTVEDSITVTVPINYLPVILNYAVIIALITYCVVRKILSYYKRKIRKTEKLGKTAKRGIIRIHRRGGTPKRE